MPVLETWYRLGDCEICSAKDLGGCRMTAGLKGRSFVSVEDFSSEELHAVLQLAGQLKAETRSGEQHHRLAGKTLVMLFQKPSLRTRVSFETGMTQLGGHAIYLAPADINLGGRETTEDVALVLGRYADLVMARVFGHEIVVELAKFAGVPVINGLSDFEHPCQIVADLQTIQERKGRLAGLRAIYVGDGNNVAHSLMFGAALVGMNLAVVTPPGFEPSGAVLAESQRIGLATGCEIEVSNDLLGAARGADVIYTDVWASMGQESEADSRRAKFKGYQINADVISVMDAGAIILHCLPAHYGEEIDYATSRLPNSAIFEQAENRLHAQKAIMVALAAP
jgi:ornithine carbamoyltransferase